MIFGGVERVEKTYGFDYIYHVDSYGRNIRETNSSCPKNIYVYIYIYIYIERERERERERVTSSVTLSNIVQFNIF